ncbi:MULTISPECIES: iron uptake transporter permease EfeU [Gordonia]|nr:MULTISPECIES: iron uptake transporter permease EfeU [Gordonia]MDH3005272.1 FTR1 family protein [Gordonia alkanivorans]MDH3014684.1 FTR1 family protein [Gordonia alkanivorans]MDH3019224.1 FTR1 family protein [Gordonia alkanivorans]MDH3022905.1 FTR1 family protein [Gordonia alkanivorans]MDH3039696.1 FTR1 family protein [Gordonia alkanivorans]
MYYVSALASSGIAVLAADGPSVWTQMVGSALIGLREGLETGIVVMVLIAFVVKTDRRDALKWIWAGVGAAVAMTLVVFLVIHFGTSTMTPLAAETIAGVASLVAVGIVTFMVLWMSEASSHISADLKSGMSKALLAGGASVLGLAFLAVGREGFETALLMVGYAESVSGGLWPLLGLVIGILAAVALTVLIYRGAIRMNLSVFFTYTGLFLIVVAAGILTYGIRALQTVGWLPGLGNTAFDISATYDASSWYGTILGGIFNVRPDPTILQVIAWIVYVVVVTTIFFRRQRAGHRAPTSKTPAARKSATPDESSAPAEPAPERNPQ